MQDIYTAVQFQGKTPTAVRLRWNKAAEAYTIHALYSPAQGDDMCDAMDHAELLAEHFKAEAVPIDKMAYPYILDY